MKKLSQIHENIIKLFEEYPWLKDATYNKIIFIYWEIIDKIVPNMNNADKLTNVLSIDRCIRKIRNTKPEYQAREEEYKEYNRNEI